MVTDSVGDDSPRLPTGEEVESRPLKDKLEALFAAVRQDGTGTPYTGAEVARAVGITPTYLSKLRSGRQHNPNPDILRRIAMFFGVEQEYLLAYRATDDQRKVADIHHRLLRLAEWQDSQQARFLLQAHTLDDHDRDLALAILETIGQANLDDTVKTTTLTLVDAVHQLQHTDRDAAVAILATLATLDDSAITSTLALLDAVQHLTARGRTAAVDMLNTLRQLQTGDD